MIKRSIWNKNNAGVAGEDTSSSTTTTTTTASASSNELLTGSAVTGDSTGSTTGNHHQDGKQQLTQESVFVDKKQNRTSQYWMYGGSSGGGLRGRGGVGGGGNKVIFLFIYLLLPVLLLSIMFLPMMTSTNTGFLDSISMAQVGQVQPLLPNSSSNSGSSRAVTPILDIGRKMKTPIILNIGSNLDPIVPRPKDDPCTVAMAMAFEPIEGHQIPPHPALHVIHAAVSYDSGWSAMNLYNKDGRSSSLNQASHLASWSNQKRWNKDSSKIKIVPTISFRTILESLQEYDLQLIMTDMQGHDFKTVSSVGNLLGKVGVRRLVTEVYKDNISTYKDSNNDLCMNWLPHMTSIGYVFEGLTKMMGDKETLLDGYRNAEEVNETCAKSMKEHPVETVGVSEYNAYWRLNSEPTVGKEGNDGILETYYLYGTHSPGHSGHVFAEEEYKKCQN
eukprot:CAMPEP_0176495046 /NCGR_PEP_ID=MMETSP0200_2-20121128/10440_1 /TAXON_ID=947934 /ORGANISM="Chaetoceros sp., Strain GSL56" /LENGTH=445 /DNA_ID=CAMNT_0017892883 /DNA_START=95 /DNA_END=1433 /DNA_ORIENTATION=+